MLHQLQVSEIIFLQLERVRSCSLSPLPTMGYHPWVRMHPLLCRLPSNRRVIYVECLPATCPLSEGCKAFWLIQHYGQERQYWRPPRGLEWACCPSRSICAPHQPGAEPQSAQKYPSLSCSPRAAAHACDAAFEGSGERVRVEELGSRGRVLEDCGSPRRVS